MLLTLILLIKSFILILLSASAPYNEKTIVPVLKKTILPFPKLQTNKG